jgi:hypothetical protein
MSIVRLDCFSGSTARRLEAQCVPMGGPTDIVRVVDWGVVGIESPDPEFIVQVAQWAALNGYCSRRSANTAIEKARQ